jgi:tRNA threonylcarbamoyladenosine biosynthesis protein TsaE
VKFISRSPEDLKEPAKFLAERLKSTPIAVFKGSMGAGKTTFIKALCEVLGVTDEVSSPTFSLINEYRTAEGAPVFHFDFYRIENEQEALDMGIYDFLDGGICLIEWAEKIPNVLKGEKFLTVRIDEESGQRIITFGD